MPFKNLSFTFLVLLIAVTLFISSCQKKHLNTGGRTSMVNPFSQYLQSTGDTVTMNISYNRENLEIGYSFTASDTGTIYEIGIRLPDTTQTYAVTLWDAAHQAVLITKNIKVVNAAGFSYDDLNSTHQAVPILANHTYVISVNLTPLPPLAFVSSENYYYASRSDQKDIFPFTQGYITYHNQYSMTTLGESTFPTVLQVSQDQINGLCDIGFSHVSN